MTLSHQHCGDGIGSTTSSSIRKKPPDYLEVLLYTEERLEIIIDKYITQSIFYKINYKFEDK